MSDPPRDLNLPIVRELGDSLKAAFRRREAREVASMLKRRRLFLLSPAAALLAAGGAFAAVTVLSGKRSAPLSGQVSAPASAPGRGTTRYSLTMSPGLQAGTVGWCIDEEVAVPVPVAINAVGRLRTFLLAQRKGLIEGIAADRELLAGHPATTTLPGGQTVTMPVPPAARLYEVREGLRSERARLAEIPRLLRDLASARQRASAAFQAGIRQLAGVGYEYKAPGQSCGHVATANSAFVGPPYIGFTGSEYSVPNPPRGARPSSPSDAVGSTTLTTTGVYLTDNRVAGVQVAPGETILTRHAATMPNGYRVAVTLNVKVEQPRKDYRPLETNRIYSAQQPPQYAANGTMPSTAGMPKPIALDANGEPITGTFPRVVVGNASVAWKPAQQFVPQYANGGNVRQLQPGARIPSGACEIQTRRLHGIHMSWGAVVPRIRAFPNLTGRNFMSCAYTSFYFVNNATNPQAAILLDAQHPNTTPPPIPGATQISRNPDIVNETITQLSGTTNFTARRTGNAWLAIEGAGTPAQQATILKQLDACVHLRGAPCRSTTTIPNLNTNQTTSATGATGSS